MDYSRPIEALVPGVQGRILGALARTDAELTMRTVARVAGVSANRATTVLNQLIGLGIVERREAGTAALVRLVRDNEAARIVCELAELRARVLGRLAETAAAINPRPASIVLFGSFARGEARAGSDIDVLVVRPDNVPADHTGWLDTLGTWSDGAARIAGNPVNLVVVARAELPQLSRRKRSVWAEIAREGVTLLGSDLKSLRAAA
jgi:predicted nucleotidyltransferase